MNPYFISTTKLLSYRPYKMYIDGIVKNINIIFTKIKRHVFNNILNYFNNDSFFSHG